MLRRVFAGKRKLTADEFVKILECTGIDFEEITTPTAETDGAVKLNDYSLENGYPIATIHIVDYDEISWR